MSRRRVGVPRPVRSVTAVVLLLGTAGCGLQVKGADLFLLTRRGHGPELSLLVNDSGTISCNGGSPKPLPDPLLLKARDLAPSLDSVAGLKLHVPRDSFNHYYIVLPYGSVSFPDTAGRTHPLLAQVEQFALQASQQACKLNG